MRCAFVVVAICGCGRVGFDEVTSLDLIDTVRNGGFPAGAFSGTRIVGDAIALDNGAMQGRFTSRVFDAGETVTWSRIEWAPLAPYGVALPDNGGAETYREGSADMRDNILLLHADLTATVGVGATLVDSSGRDHHPVVVGGPLAPADGVFGGGFDDSLPSRLEIDLSVASHAIDFSFGTGDWTWATWLATPFPCMGNDSLANDTYFGVDDDRTANGEHLWFGCLHPTDSNCAAQGATQGRLGGTLISISNTGDGGSYCGTGTITDGRAHLLAITKRGHTPATIETWIDGTKDFTGPINFGAPFQFTDGKPFNIAGEPGARQGAGVYDEIAIFRRALADDEVRAMFLRGVRRLQIVVRACDAPDCSDAAFSDPYFDIGRGFPIGAELGVQGRYFQYEATFEGIAAADGSPQIDLVQLFVAR